MLYIGFNGALFGVGSAGMVVYIIAYLSAYISSLLGIFGYLINSKNPILKDYIKGATFISIASAIFIELIILITSLIAWVPLLYNYALSFSIVPIAFSAVFYVTNYKMSVKIGAFILYTHILCSIVFKYVNTAFFMEIFAFPMGVLLIYIINNNKVKKAKYWSKIEKLKKKKNYEELLKLYQEIGMKREYKLLSNKLNKISLAKGYETAMNYGEAAKIYEELGMYEDARRCREKMQNMNMTVSGADMYGTGNVIKSAGVGGTSAVVDSGKIRKMYNMEYKKNNKIDTYNWGDFEEYEILRKIGSGGFSDVYLVERNGERYAMKIPKGSDLRGDETLILEEKDLEQYGKEAEIWAVLTEKIPHAVVNLVDAGIRPFPWFVMELAEQSLKDRMKDMSEKEKMEVAIELLDKLDRIHHMGVVHKDIKPENVLYEGEWKFSDFGLSKIINKSSKSSQIMSGTPLYMAPEQVSKKKYGATDWRTDIWQMGVLLYELFTGHLPFEVDDAGELAMAVLMEEPEPATKYGVRVDVWRVIKKALQKDKNDRWQSAAEMKVAFSQFLP